MTKLRRITAAALGVMMALAPVGGFAKDNHPGKGHGNGNGNGNGRHHVRVAPRDIVVIDRDRDQLVRTNRGIVVANCPPGLAKKNPPCVPPGHARRGHGDRDHDHHDLAVGDVLDWDDIHLIRQPGLYGLGDPPGGNRYAIVDGRLVRVESETGRLLSIIRLVNAILD